jgi:hypothetical protein
MSSALASLIVAFLRTVLPSIPHARGGFLAITLSAPLPPASNESLQRPERRVLLILVFSPSSTQKPTLRPVIPSAYYRETNGQCTNKNFMCFTLNQHLIETSKNSGVGSKGDMHSFFSVALPGPLGGPETNNMIKPINKYDQTYQQTCV